jgi:O-antigen/teichoic acid export membrane protein
MAKEVGPMSFGVYSTIAAIVLFVSPFAAFGSGGLIVQYGSVNNSRIGEFYGNSVVMLLLSSVVFLLLSICIVGYIFNSVEYLLILLLIFCSEFLFVKLVEITNQAYQANSEMSSVAFNNIYFSSARLVVVLIVYALELQSEVVNWLVVQCVIFALLSLALVCQYSRRVKIIFNFKGNLIPQSLHYSLGLSSQGVYKESDKAIISKFGLLEQVGLYSVAVKIIDFGFAATRAYFQLMYKGFFVAGTNGFDAIIIYCKKVLKTSAMIAVFSSLCLFLLAEYIAVFLGEEYSESTRYVKYLSFLPLVRAVSFPLADVLTGLGKQKLRSTIQMIVAAISITLNIIFISEYGILAAIAVTYLSEFFLIVSYAICLMLPSVRVGSVNESTH